MSSTVSAAMQRQPTGPPVLLTGATGFIGWHLRLALIARGYEVHAMSRNQSESDDPFHHVCDLTNAKTLRRLLAARPWYAIIHLAGLVSYKASDAYAMQGINVSATRNLLAEAIDICPNVKFLFCSSVAAVGSLSSPHDAPLNEDAVWQPEYGRAAYMRTKHQAEEIVRAAGKARKIPAAALCPSTVYGPRDALKSNRKTQVKASNGSTTLYTNGGVSIVHIDVVVDAFVKLLETPLEDCIWHGSRWILSGENVTVRDMLTMHAREGGYPDVRPWLRLPNWLLWLLCSLSEMFGIGSLGVDRFRVATRYHWYDGSRAREQFSLRDIPASKCIADSVAWMRDQGLLGNR